MQEPSPRPPTLRLMQAGTAGEREILEAFLDFYRDVLVHKVRGIDDDDAQRQLLPSPTTLIGLVKHLTVVERNWFHQLTDTIPDVPLESEPTPSWTIIDTDTLDRALAAYDHRIRPRRRRLPPRRGPGVPALDLHPHDRGDSPPHRPR